MMKKYIIFIFLLLNSLSSFSVGNSLVGPTTVDPGTYYSYRANLDETLSMCQLEKHLSQTSS